MPVYGLNITKDKAVALISNQGDKSENRMLKTVNHVS